MSIDNINESNENFYNDKKLKFLVSCTMKAIFGTDAGREVLQGNLELIMGEAKVGYQNFKFRESGKGNFVTVSAEVTVSDAEQFANFYKKPKLLPGLRWTV